VNYTAAGAPLFINGKDQVSKTHSSSLTRVSEKRGCRVITDTVKQFLPERVSASAFSYFPNISYHLGVFYKNKNLTIVKNHFSHSKHLLQ